MDDSVPAAYFLPTVPNDWHIQGVGDFNGDSHADMVWQNDDGRVFLWEMTSASQVDTSNVVNFTTTPPNSALAGIGDVNADGKSDLIWRDQSDGTVILQTTGVQFLQRPRFQPFVRVVGDGIEGRCVPCHDTPQRAVHIPLFFS
jgi:hypothetical protein